MLAERRRRGHVVVIQGHNAVDLVAAGQVAGGVGDVGLGVEVGHGEEGVEQFARPRFAGDAFAYQHVAAARCFISSRKGRPLNSLAKQRMVGR